MHNYSYSFMIFILLIIVSLTVLFIDKTNGLIPRDRIAWSIPTKYPHHAHINSARLQALQRALPNLRYSSIPCGFRVQPCRPARRSRERVADLSAGGGEAASSWAVAALDPSE